MAGSPPISVGRVVIYRSRTGDYAVPALVNCTTETLYQPGVDAGHVPPLSSAEHVHLTVFTPGKPGKRRDASDFKVESAYGRSENVAGCYQEWDVPFSETGYEPGTWSWPKRVP